MVKFNSFVYRGCITFINSLLDTKVAPCPWNKANFEYGGHMQDGVFFQYHLNSGYERKVARRTQKGKHSYEIVNEQHSISLIQESEILWKTNCSDKTCDMNT